MVRGGRDAALDAPPGAARRRECGLRHAPVGGLRRPTEGALRRWRGQHQEARSRTAQRRVLRRAA
eukprot:10278379-Alexandrium_andersonii.AAC.1